MYLTIIILPLLGSIISGFLGRKIGVYGSQLITSSLIVITTILSIIVYFEVGFNNIPVHIHIFKWIDCGIFNISWAFNFDSVTISMLIPVLVVSSLVHIYSIEYMSHDPHNQRFFSYLSLFTFMMIILVTANNYLLMFVGWEGVGVCSYLLVNFWYTRIAANQSSLSAFLTNRVGDCLLTIGMFVILWSFGNLDFSTIFTLAPYINSDIITITGICLLIGAMAKSSQIGLHVWLPLAMEGPTPVSALIHAATMVTAGVYLLIRTSPLLEYSSTTLILCLWVGAITTIFSSLIGLFQQDIKKVIAYSTMSQLGMMVVAVGLSSYNVALFHLVNHAFYKALLFLGAGAVIHAVYDNQDFRKYGSLKQFLPLTYSVMLIASLSLVAFPFMTGFYSKDFIIESAFAQFLFSSITVYYITIIGAAFTTLYSIKVLYLTFLANPNGPLINYKNIHENGLWINLPLIILAIFSIFFGYFAKDIFIGLGSNFFLDNGIFVHPLHECSLNTEFAKITLYKLLPLSLVILLSILSFIMLEFINKYLIYMKFTNLGYSIFSLLSLRFFIELFYNNYVIKAIITLGSQTTKVLDKGSIELIGPYGLEKTLSILSNKLSTLDTGIVISYALYILIGLVFYILIPTLSYINYLLLLLVLISIIANTNDSTHYSNNLQNQHAILLPCVGTLFSIMVLKIKSKIISKIKWFILNKMYYGARKFFEICDMKIFLLFFYAFEEVVRLIAYTVNCIINDISLIGSFIHKRGIIGIITCIWLLYVIEPNPEIEYFNEIIKMVISSSLTVAITLHAKNNAYLKTHPIVRTIIIWLLELLVAFQTGTVISLLYAIGKNVFGSPIVKINSNNNTNSGGGNSNPNGEGPSSGGGGGPDPGGNPNNIWMIPGGVAATNIPNRDLSMNEEQQILNARIQEVNTRRGISWSRRVDLRREIYAQYVDRMYSGNSTALSRESERRWDLDRRARNLDIQIGFRWTNDELEEIVLKREYGSRYLPKPVMGPKFPEFPREQKEALLDLLKKRDLKGFND